MNRLSYSRHRLPPVIIQHAVWLYFRFALSYRDVEDMLAERGIDVSYETVRRWAFKFGRAYAGQIRRARPKPSDRWHLDEVFIRIGGKVHYLWRAVDDEGDVLDSSSSHVATGQQPSSSCADFWGGRNTCPMPSSPIDVDLMAPPCGILA